MGVQTVLGANFSAPYGIALDGSGNVYVADSGNNCIKEIMAVNGVIPAAPTINIIAGGFSVPSGVAVDSSGNVYVADAGDSVVDEVLAVNGSIPASPTIVVLGAQFSQPYGVAVDKLGNVYVADAGTSQIDELLAVNGSIPAAPTVISLGSGFGVPSGIAVDNIGNVFVADTGNNAVEEIVAVNGTIPANPVINTLSTDFQLPYGVAVDGSGNLFVVDVQTNDLSEILAVNGSIPAVPTMITLANSFDEPVGVAVDASGNIYIGDTAHNAVDEIQPSTFSFGNVAVGSISTPIMLDYAFLTGGTIDAPLVLTQGVTGLDYADALTGSCTTNGIGHTYSAGDTCVLNVTLAPRAPGYRSGAALLANTTGGRATAYLSGIATGPQLGFVPGTQTIALPSLDSDPAQIAIDGGGSIYIADAANNQVLKETLSNGSFTKSTIGTGLSSPNGVAVDAAGYVYVADGGNSRVLVELPVAGSYSQRVVDSGPQFSGMQGIAVDGAGNVYVAASSVVKESLVNGNYRASNVNVGGPQHPLISVDGAGNLYATALGTVIKVALTNGISSITTVATGLNDIAGITVDGDGNVYLADQADKSLLKESPSGGSYAQSTVPMTYISGPTALAVDGNGNVYVADAGKQLLEDNFSSTPGLAFLTTTAAGTTDTTDGSQTITLFNSGTTPLTGALTVPANFSMVAGSGAPADCTAALLLQSGASCNVSIEFAPVAGTASGSVNSAALANDNNLNTAPSATQTIALSGSVGNPALAVHFVISATQTTVTAGTPFSFTVTAEDSSNNIDTTFTGPVSLTSSDPAFVSSGSVSLVNGAGTSAATLATAGSQTIQAAHNSSTGSISFTVQPGPAAQIHPVAGTNQTAYEGAPFAAQLQLQVVDAYGNPVPGVTIVFSAPDTGASVTFTTPYNGNTYQAMVTTLSNGIAISPVATANTIAGQYGLTASIPGLQITATYTLNNLAIPQYLVSVLTDDIGIAGNCLTTGSNSNCSLRDAITAVNALPVGTNSTIGFSSGLTGTIALTQGALTLNSDVTVTGAGSGRITIDAGGSSEIFSVPNGVTAALSNLTLNNGNASQYGGAIGNQGILTITDCTLSNSTAQFGGAIYTDGTLVLINSTLSGNTAQTYGGAIDNAATLIVRNSTVSGNTAGSYGGGIHSVSAPTMTNSVVAGNAASTYADIYTNGSGSVDPSNIASVDPSGTSQVNALLAQLANYGGTTPTMMPLPGSPAICNGLVADIPTGLTTDQRGNQRTTNYAQTPCVDAGAVQTKYSLSFVQQPTDSLQGAGITPAPTVQLAESGNPFTAAAETIAIALNGAGTLTGNTASTIITNGLATYPALVVSASGTGDTLLASLALNSTTNTSTSAASNTFNVTAAGPGTITVISGGLQSAAIGSPFAQALTVKVTDANGNAVSGATVTFSAPATGPGATLSASSAVTGAAGTVSVTAIANGSASSNAYHVTATASTGTASFVLTNIPVATGLIVAPQSVSLVYGQPLTVKAAVTPVNVLGSSPAGSVQFYDGSAVLGPAVPLVSASATDIITAPAAGSHSYQAQYGGDADFAPSVLTKANAIVMVAKASSTLTGPATQVVLTAGAGGSIKITIASQYTGTGISMPGGSVAYTIGSGAAQTAIITTGGATINVPASLAAGNYIAILAYAGDSNYAAATSLDVSFTVSAAGVVPALIPTTTVLKINPASASPGSVVTLTATVVPTSGNTVPTGSVTFRSGTTVIGSAALATGGVATYTTTTLQAGSDSLSAIYAGDAVLAGSTSAPVVVNIAEPSFSLTFNPATITIKQGMSGTVQLTLKAINGFSQPVNLSCSGLPADALCTFPPSVTPSAAGTTSSFAISTNVNATAIRPEARPGQKLAAPALPFVAGAGLTGLCLLFGIPARRRLKNFAGLYALLAAVLLGGAAAGITIGCGTQVETPTGSSTVTVMATSTVNGTTVTQEGTVQLTIAVP